MHASLFLGHKCASEGSAIRAAWGWGQLAGRRGDGRDLFQQLPPVCVLLCLVARCWKHSVWPAWRWESCLIVSLLFFQHTAVGWHQVWNMCVFWMVIIDVDASCRAWETQKTHCMEGLCLKLSLAECSAADCVPVLRREVLETRKEKNEQKDVVRGP